MTQEKAIQIENKAKDILSAYGYHEGNVIDYDSALEMLIDVLTDE